MRPLIDVIRVGITSIREGAIRRFNATGRPGETFEDGTFLQQYGLASRPKANSAEGLVIKKGNGVYLIATGDRAVTIELADGEVALHTDEGDNIHLKRDRIIEVNGGEKVIVNTKVAEINATTSAKIVSPVVELGDGALKKLVNEEIVTKINAATFGGYPIDSPIVLADVATSKTKAS